eukprot:scaffold5668_cov111-Isochrysis_galbana.AAC.3
MPGDIRRVGPIGRDSRARGQAVHLFGRCRYEEVQLAIAPSSFRLAEDLPGVVTNHVSVVGIATVGRFPEHLVACRLCAQNYRRGVLFDYREASV